jgi:hypothetical protein
MNDVVVINKVYYKGSDKPLTPKQLARAAGYWLTEYDLLERISGNGHCDCKNGGEFELLPTKNYPVKEGNKRYMKCRICGGHSHL